MDAHSPLLQRCIQEAASSSKATLERCLDEAVTALQAAESSSIKLVERDGFAVAAGSLLKLRAVWGAQYAAGMATALSSASATDAEPLGRVTASAFAALGGSASGFAGLTLVDDAQVTQDIEFARLSQQLRLQVDPVMADLDALISAALGLDNVRPELNPLRPEVFAQALRGLLDVTDVEPGTRALWLKYLAVPMGRELRALYERLIGLLEGANVQAVSYRMVQNPSGAGGVGGRDRPEGAGGLPARAGAGGSSRGGGGGEPTGRNGEDARADVPAEYFTDPSNVEVGEALFQDFLTHGVDSQARLAASYYHQVDEELRALRSEVESPSDSQQAELPSIDRALPVVDRPRRRVDGQSPLSPQVWGPYAKSSARKLVRAELKKEATHVGQVLGLEVVRKLVSEVAQDPRLLVPVREAIVALEPSLLRLAMVDPRFFSEETHPGRRLMERVAQRSFKYNDEESSGFITFFESVNRAFNGLNGQKIDGAQPFNSALSALENTWTESDRDEEARRHEVLHGLRFAEERQAMADQIAYDMSSRPDLDKVPGPVLDFLFGPWSLVMAHARLVDQANQIDPRGLGLVVSDLIWSVKQDFTLRHPAKLMDMIPGMLRKLNAGLDLIGQDEREREPFFEILMRLHRPVLKLRRLKSEQDSLESSAAPLDSDLLPATAEQRVPKVASQPWLAPREQDGAGFEDTLPTATADLEDESPASADSGGAKTEVDVLADSASPNVEQILTGLSTGCWVDLFSHQRWRRAQLVWASTKGTLFMFVSHGGRPHSMTKRSCERLIAHYLLRPVQSHGVVARALESLKNQPVAENAGHANPSPPEQRARGQALAA